MTVAEANSSWILENLWMKLKDVYILYYFYYFLLCCHLVFLLILFLGTVFLSPEDHVLYWSMPCPLLLIVLVSPHGIFGDTAGLQSGPHSLSFINFSYQFNVTFMSHWAVGNCTAGLKQDRTGRAQKRVVEVEIVSSVNNRSNLTTALWGTCSPTARKSINI